MCDALMKIIKEELDSRERIGETNGEARGEARFALLTDILLNSQRIVDLQKATRDEAYRNQLFDELNL